MRKTMIEAINGGVGEYDKTSLVFKEEDPEEIAKLCERLNLDEHESLVLKMNPNMYEDGKEMMELCLVGRVFGNKIVNREGLSDVAKQVWRTSRKVRVESMGVTNTFMFHFGSEADR
ncbi:hypothetical protein TorRG33x02_145680 [Trema orientale]|uniref:DUF4283 domain-containing protein n=1 Tax=Trema orientale TaxID=63057 RepID=A0A2P5EVL4_TREOI|nr:hypothetical protein TorRG33x02_145680 [Trema orientale]